MDEKFSCDYPTEHGQVSECVDHNTQTIAAGLSQCLTMDILNDVVQFGLECFAGKGLHGLGFWILDGGKVQLRLQLNMAKSVNV
eukprot:scaffold100809_cov36-Cyclotella_meneghiniana.AAC.1